MGDDTHSRVICVNCCLLVALRHCTIGSFRTRRQDIPRVWPNIGPPYTTARTNCSIYARADINRVQQDRSYGLE